jgi:hypothetical protein
MGKCLQQSYLFFISKSRQNHHKIAAYRMPGNTISSMRYKPRLTSRIKQCIIRVIK